MATVPHISAVQIYLLRHPGINFELTSALAMLDMFSTGDLIRSVLKDQISKALVYPNMISIKLCSEAKDLSFKMPTIDGVVKMKIEKFEGVIESKIFLDVSLGDEMRKIENVEMKKNSALLNVDYELISYRDGDDKVEVVLSGFDEDGKITNIGK